VKNGHVLCNVDSQWSQPPPIDLLAYWRAALAVTLRLRAFALEVAPTGCRVAWQRSAPVFTLTLRNVSARPVRVRGMLDVDGQTVRVLCNVDSQ
jgi:hypothetical protein